MSNILLHTDVYKMGHMEQYNPEIEYIQSHLIARSDKKFKELVFFGTQYYIQKYLTQTPSLDDVDEFIQIRQQILGIPISDACIAQLKALSLLKSWPLLIKSYPEGSLVGIQTPLMTVENTVPGMHWCVGFIESLLLKLWNTCTVATNSRELRKIFEKAAHLTGSSPNFIPFQVHDFGYRSVSSEETAALSGAAHLLSFLGTDTVLAVDLLNRYYCTEPNEIVGVSVPASEHSVMCSFTKAYELDAFKNMLHLYPTGIVSIVSDSYDLFNVLSNFTDELKQQILDRNGKVVFRPDSGDPVSITLKTIQMLDEKFGHTLTEKGFKVLNPKVGMIYGDGMYTDRIVETLEVLASNGYASQNLVVGVGGLLLQQHNRDDMGFSFKANWGKLKSGKEMDIFKSPITDPGKNSIKGYIKNPNFEIVYNNGTTDLGLDSLSQVRGRLGWS